MMDFDKQVEAFRANAEAHMRGGNSLSSDGVANWLEAVGMENWRVVWETLPRDQVFDYLYAARPDVPDEEPRPFLYRPGKSAQTHAIISRAEDRWITNDGVGDIINWLVENPPFEEVRPLANLYEHAQMIDPAQCPWVLMMALIGRRPLITQPYLCVPDARLGVLVGVHKLMPIGATDAGALGAALTAWNNANEAASAYAFLLDAYTSHLGSD